MTLQLLTPCCRASILPETESTSYSSHASYEDVVGFACAGDGCFNSWDRAGNQTYPLPVNKLENR